MTIYPENAELLFRASLDRVWPGWRDCMGEGVVTNNYHLTMAEQRVFDAALRRSVRTMKGNTMESAKKNDERSKEREDRLDQFLLAMRRQSQHNTPIPSAMIAELEAIIALGRGGNHPVEQHRFPGTSGHLHDHRRIIVGAGDKVAILNTAEEALEFVRGLPVDLRAQLHWVRAERAILAGLDHGDPRELVEAANALEAADAEDRKGALGAKPLERLPDGRVREDRFNDRRPPPPPTPPPPSAPESAA